MAGCNRLVQLASSTQKPSVAPTTMLSFSAATAVGLQMAKIIRVIFWRIKRRIIVFSNLHTSVEKDLISDLILLVFFAY
jgi:hypothetical protein